MYSMIVILKSKTKQSKQSKQSKTNKANKQSKTNKAKQTKQNRKNAQKHQRFFRVLIQRPVLGFRSFPGGHGSRIFSSSVFF